MTDFFNGLLGLGDMINWGFFQNGTFGENYSGINRQFFTDGR